MANGIILEPAAFSSVTASNTATGYSAANVGNDRMGLVWKSDTGAASRYLIIDLGSDVTFDTITLHGLTGAQAAWQLTVEIATAAQGSAFSGSQWTDSAQDLLAGSVDPVSGKGRGIWQAPAGAPSAGRYIKLTFSSLSSAAVEVARIVVAAKLQLGINFSYGAAFGIRDTGEVSYSNRGVALIREGVKKRGVGLTAQGATRAEVEGSILPLLERVGNTDYIAVVVDPDADDQRQNRIYYGLLQGDLGAIWAGYDRFTWAVNLVADD